MIETVSRRLLTMIIVAQAIFLVACATSEIRGESANSTWRSGDFDETDSAGKINSETAIDVKPRMITDNVYAQYLTPEDKRASIYIATMRTISRDAFFSLFSKQPVEHPDHPESGYYIQEETGETGTWRENDNVTTYYSERGSLYDSCAAVIRFYKGEQYLEGLEVKDNELDSSLKRAIDNMLVSFGESNYCLKVYKIPEDLFWEVSEYQYENNLLYAAKSGDEEDKKVFGEYEEFYYVRIFPLVDDIPIMSGFTGDPDKGSLISGTDITAIVIDNNIEAIVCSQPYQVESISEDNVELITFTDAEDILRRKYSELLYHEPVIFTELSLIYCPIPDSYNLDGGSAGSYHLTPAWFFSDGNGTEIYINAVTGREL